MIKCGILTFHRAVNYGAVLQSYALNKAANLLGFETEIIDYRCKFIEDYYNSWKLLFPRNWKRFCSYLIFNGNFNPNKNRLFDFLKKNANVSKNVYYNIAELKTIEEYYDCFITGSDQIWNPYTAGFDEAYFLTFINTQRKKNSYAASFGLSELPEEYKNEYIKRLQSFANYSVREDSGKEIIEKLLGIEATVDLDPTLLLTKSNWTDILDDNLVRSGIKEKKYILIYAISENKKMILMAKKIAKKKSSRVWYINDRWRKCPGVKNISKVNIDEWLYLFLHADYIITDSFHGTAFSINFEKNFIVYQNEPTGKSSRIVSLLKQLNLLGRIYYEGNSNENLENIDFAKVQTELKKLREKSIVNLKNILETSKNEND